MNPAMMNSAGGAAAITPSDTVDLGFSSLYVGGAGNIAVVMESGGVVLFSAVPAGSILPVRGRRVNATNTTATLIVALS